MTWSTSDLISFSALIISVVTFIYNYHSSKAHIEIKNIIKSRPNDYKDDANEYNYIIQCNIENRSKNPIKITKIKFNNYEAFPKKLRLGNNGVKKFNQIVNFEGYSFELPIKLDSYESEDGAILITSKTPIKTKHINLLKLYTTRGIMYFFLGIPRKLYRK